MFFAAELKESEKRMRNLAHMKKKDALQMLCFTQNKFGKDANGYINLSISRQILHLTQVLLMNRYSGS
jgi:CRP/FNR family transcriptional regulator